MKVAIFEIGNYFDMPDVVRVFSSEATAIAHLPEGFVRKDAYEGWLYYTNEKAERYANIKTYTVETKET